MLSQVKELEGTIDTHSKKINTLASGQALEKLRENAEGSLETMQRLLSLAENQL
jgi:hypothetical protein